MTRRRGRRCDRLDLHVCRPRGRRQRDRGNCR